MQTKRIFPALLPILLVGLLAMLSACSVIPGLAAASSDPPDPPIAVTPIDTSPGTLDVSVTINEDQDATDGTSNITLHFSTHLIEEDNYVLFDDSNEAVVCNDRRVSLGSAQMYTFHIQRRRYTCTYSGNRNDGMALDFIQMFSFPLGPMLSPKPPSVNSNGFSIGYNPDPDTHCNITATAKDFAGDSDVLGTGQPSNTGVYNGPSTGSLKGNGEIVLTRNCSVPQSSPFHSLTISYASTASVEVTWTH